jgi:penicillin-binding protein 1A
MNVRSVFARVEAAVLPRAVPARSRRPRERPLPGVSRRDDPPRRGVLFVTLAVAASVSVLGTLLAATEFHRVHFNRDSLPDLGPFIRFEFPTIGRIYDTHGEPLLQLAREYRQITQYEDLPPIVRAAILATEDKRFFSHNGVDYASIPRVLGKIRVGGLIGRLAAAERDDAGGRAMFPQGGSTITQQLVRGVFLQRHTSEENSAELRSTGILPRALSSVVGARNVNMMLRKREEVRLSLWVERQMHERFGSKRRAKEEILSRYASFVYMGHGQYGFARAATFYLGRPLSALTADDADTAALLAGIMKSPRDYAPTSTDSGRILHRRNQILALMAARGFITSDRLAVARQRALPPLVPQRASAPSQSSAVIGHVLEELGTAHDGLGIDDLQLGRIQVYSTVDARVQRIVSDALEQGLERYEQRHAGTRGLVQGAIVVLRNRDAAILAEAGGRQVFNGRPASHGDYNRVTRSLRQPGSAMKPMVYLAAFRRGGFTLDTLVPDEPISVPDGETRPPKWIANYDGRFKGLMPLRVALAESRNAVAIWMTRQIGIESILQTSRSLGVRTPLQRYPTTALGASETNLLELANAYRTMASGLVAAPHVIRAVARDSSEAVPVLRRHPVPVAIDAAALRLIQEGLRGVVRLPSGTAHTLAARAFPIAVMGKTGTTNEFRDAIFVGSTFGPDGITVAVRIGFDDNRSLGPRETGGRLALPVFRDVMLNVYRNGLVGAVPAFPDRMERNITAFLMPPSPLPATNIVVGDGAASFGAQPSTSGRVSR